MVVKSVEGRDIDLREDAETRGADAKKKAGRWPLIVGSRMLFTEGANKTELVLDTRQVGMMQ